MVIVGQLTDECVESAVRSAADLGYLVTVVEDACASLTPEKHAKGLDGVKGFARITSTAQMLDEVVDGLSSQLNEGSEVASHSVGFHDDLNDDTVVAYLQRKGLYKVAKQLDMMLAIQAIAKGEKKDHHRRRDEDRKESSQKSPSRSSKSKRSGSLRHHLPVSSPGSATKSEKKVEDSNHSPTSENKGTVENHVSTESADGLVSPSRTARPPVVPNSPAAMLPGPPLVDHENSPTKSPSRRSRSRSKTRLSIRGGDEEARLDSV